MHEKRAPFAEPVQGVKKLRFFDAKEEETAVA